MGVLEKVEKVFGSVEAGEQFARQAFEEPILRLNLDGEEFPTDRKQLARFQAIAGIVSSPHLDTLPEPTLEGVIIQIKPAIVVQQDISYARLSNALSMPEAPISRIDIHGAALRVTEVPTDEEDLEKRLTTLINRRNGSLTISRTPFILRALEQLDEAQHRSPTSLVTSSMAKVALAAIWL